MKRKPSNPYATNVGVPNRDIPALQEIQERLVLRTGINISRAETISWCIRNSSKHFDTLIADPAIDEKRKP